MIRPRKYVALSLWLYAGLIFAGCEIFGEQEPPVLVPLAVGNYWRYQSTYLETIVDSFTVEITRALNVQDRGRTYKAFGQIFRPNAVPERPPYEWLYANGQEGLYTMGGVAETDTLGVRFLYRKYPGRVGDTWPMVRLTYRGSTTRKFAVLDSLEMTLLATKEDFVTPLGTFQCYVYKYSYRPADDVFAYWNVYEYYAPDVGLVGEIIKSQLPGWPESMQITQRTLLYQYRVK